MSEELENLNEKELEDILRLLDSVDVDESNGPDYDAIIETFGLDLEELETDMNSYTPKIDLPFSKSNPDAVNPNYAYETDSGFDLYSTEEIWVHSLDRKLIPTGIHIDIPDGYEIQVRSKSGLALKQGLMVLNSPGTVDQGYTGEIQVIIFNTSKERVKLRRVKKLHKLFYVLSYQVNGLI